MRSCARPFRRVLPARSTTTILSLIHIFLGVLSLGIVKGSTITLVADGADEQEAIDTLTALINSDFSE